MKIITISREFGSGGRTIGRQAVKRLGIPCYDHELIERFSKERGFSKEYIEEKGEQATPSEISRPASGSLLRLSCIKKPPDSSRQRGPPPGQPLWGLPRTANRKQI